MRNNSLNVSHKAKENILNPVKDLIGPNISGCTCGAGHMAVMPGAAGCLPQLAPLQRVLLVVPGEMSDFKGNLGEY